MAFMEAIIYFGEMFLAVPLIFGWFCASVRCSFGPGRRWVIIGGSIGAAFPTLGMLVSHGFYPIVIAIAYAFGAAYVISFRPPGRLQVGAGIGLAAALIFGLIYSIGARHGRLYSWNDFSTVLLIAPYMSLATMPLGRWMARFTETLKDTSVER